MNIIIYLLVGFIGGILSGAFGIGGGADMVPLLVLLFGLTQHQAQGRILAVLLAPVGILVVMRYYAAGNVEIQSAVFIALGFILIWPPSVLVMWGKSADSKIKFSVS